MSRPQAACLEKDNCLFPFVLLEMIIFAVQNTLITMAITRINLLQLCMITILSGCRNHYVFEQELMDEISRLRKEPKENPIDFTVHFTSVYDPYHCFINRKDRIWQDMILEHNIHEDGELYYCANFYNYGGSIKLYNGYRRDCFVLLGDIQEMRPIKDLANIVITEVINDEKYGEYALVDWKNGNSLGGYSGDTFMTPMAYNAYQTKSGDDNLIFVRFLAEYEHKYMSVIFKGGDFERIVIEKYPNSIGVGLFPGAGHFDPGQFWHQL